MSIYYIYAYIRSDGTPYYIGKGSKQRAWSRHDTIQVPKDKSKIVIMEYGLTEVGALALERRYIRWYGRKDLGTGILRNITDGGDGSNPSIEVRKKISESNRNRIWSIETKNKMSAARIGNKYASGEKINETFEFSCIHCGKKEIKRSTAHNKRMTCCSKSCAASHGHKSKLQSFSIKK